MTLTEVKKLSPVKITYKYSVSGGGEYVGSNRCINITKNLKRNDKIECLLHEIGHAIHHANNCRCMLNLDNHALAEYHAARFVMKHIQNNSVLIKVFIDKVNRELKNAFYRSPHLAAVKRIIKLKQWDKFIIRG